MDMFGESWSRTLRFQQQKLKHHHHHHHPHPHPQPESSPDGSPSCSSLLIPPGISPIITASTNTSSSTDFLPRSTHFSSDSTGSGHGGPTARPRRKMDSYSISSSSITFPRLPNLMKMMQRNFYTFVLLSSALVILILSPSASANRCTPTFTLISNGAEGNGMVEWNGGEGDISKAYQSAYHHHHHHHHLKTSVLVREGSSYKLNCSLNKYHSVKWMISGREVTPQLMEAWDIDIEKGEEMEGYIYTELRVNNASQKHHNGEYKCTTVCMSNAPGANQGVFVTINIAINVTIADSDQRREGMDIIYRKYVTREKSVEFVCKAAVANAQMTWYRIKDDKRTEEDMSEVCGVPDAELKERLQEPPNHCTISTKQGKSEDNPMSSITLKIHRARKEGNETLKTISDFRKYVCRAVKNGQDGYAYADLAETVSAERKFDKGHRSLTVLEGNKLLLYCDIHGIDKKEFESGATSLIWKKDDVQITGEELKKTKKIAEHMVKERGKPYRSGFTYEMAEREHRGWYTCEVVRSSFSSNSDDSNNNSTLVNHKYYVRVKDKLGALWPFLGICGEVIILCTIILIYEKRHNKTELDESDTDGSPDQ